MSALQALQAYEQTRAIGICKREARRSWRFLEEDEIDTSSGPDDRSGVYLLFDLNSRKIVAAFTGVFVLDRKRCEKERSPLSASHRTPGGLPAIVPKKGRSLFLTAHRLREVERQQQIMFQQVPRNTLDSLAESEYGVSWSRVTVQQCLVLLDVIVDIHRW